MRPHRTSTGADPARFSDRLDKRFPTPRPWAVVQLCDHSKSFETVVTATIPPPVRNRASRHVIYLILLVTALVGLVHQPIAAVATENLSAKPEITTPADVGRPLTYDRRTDLSKLPRPVAEMLDTIQIAVASGEIEDLRTAIEWNELPPTFGPDEVDDPIEFLKEASADKSGRQMLAILADLISVAPARQPLGRDPENTGVFIWPYLAERPIDQLTPAEQVDLYRLVPAEVITTMREKKRWTWYRMVIGADGTWHAFSRHD